MNEKNENITLQNKNICKIIFDNTVQLMFLIGTNGDVIAANRRVVEFFGIEESEMIGKKIWEQKYVAEERREIVKKNIEIVTAGKKIEYEAEIIYMNMDSFLDISMKPIFDEEEFVIGVLFEAYDITERKRLEEALKKYQRESMVLNKELSEEKEKIANALSSCSLETAVINKQLQEEKEKLDYYLEVAKVMFIIVGNDKKVKYINTEGCSVIEYDRKDILGKEIMSFISEKKRENIDGIISGILSEELIGINGFELEIITGNGEEKNIECNISLIYDIKNSISGFILSGNDRTSEKILEAEREQLLLEMKGRIREIESLYSVAIFAQSGKELDSKFVDAVLKGWKNSEKMSGRIILKDKEYRSTNFKEKEIVVERNLFFNNEKIGKIEVYFEKNKESRKNNEKIGKNTGDYFEVLYKMIENIIASKQLEEKLINNNIQLKETQHIAKLGTWEYEIGSEKIYWSDETYSIFGIMNKEGVDYKKYMGKLYTDLKAVVENPMILLDEERKLKDKMVEYIKDDGTKGYAIINTQALLENGIPKKIRGSILDVTEMKLTQIELEKAREAAESSNKAKTLFLANMSHEIRTPLNAILGFSQLLMRNESINSEGKNQLNIIMKSGEHLLSIINSILELAKIETGKIIFEKEKISIKRVIKDVMDMFVNQAKEKGVNLFFKLEGDGDTYCIGDEKKIRQIYINLIGNSLKFTEKGKIEVSINIKRENGKKIRVESYVEDTGIGMPESYLSKAFGRFEQAENNIWKKGGTGLGLAITKEFLNFMQGEIKISSKLNEGSRFDFYYYVDESFEKFEENSSNKVLCRIDDGRKIKALIVDDVENNVILLKECMKIAGVEADEARDGKKAIKMSKDNEYDIIFMDIVMPVLNGITATKEIRKNNEKPIIVAVTASVFEEEKQEVMKYGISEFLRKPFKEEDIYEILKRRLGINYKYVDLQEQRDIEEITEESFEWKKNIPKELLEEIKDAVINGDVDKIIEITEVMKSYDEKFSIKIKEFAKAYKFDELNMILEI